MRKFIDDDEGYEKWLEENPRRYAVNCERSLRRSYLKLHRAFCDTISLRSAKAEHWTKDYIKVCSNDIVELSNWAKTEVRGKLDRCEFCM